MPYPTRTERGQPVSPHDDLLRRFDKLKSELEQSEQRPDESLEEYRERVSRNIAMLIDFHQRWMDYLDKLDVSVDNSVTVTIEGTNVRFQDIDQLSGFIADRINK